MLGYFSLPDTTSSALTMVDISGTVTDMSDREVVAEAMWTSERACSWNDAGIEYQERYRRLADAAIKALGGSTEVAVQTRLPVVPDATKRGTRLPEDWQPSEPVRAELSYQYPGVNFYRILQEFRDYWCAVPGQRGLKLSWDRTFRNRVREVAHKPQYLMRDNNGRPVRVEMSKVDAKAMGYLED